MHNPFTSKWLNRILFRNALILCLLLGFSSGALGSVDGCPGIPLKAHPFHVGLAELYLYDNRVELAIRVFTDDLEMMMNKRFRKDVDLTLGDSLVNFELLQILLREEVGLQADSNAIGLIYVGCEREDDSIWLYLEQDGIGAKQRNWRFKLTLLSRLFPEQRYVVSVNQNGRKTSQLLTGPDFLIQWTTD